MPARPQIYAAPLAGGGRAVVLHNRHSILSHLQAANITVRWVQLGFAPEEEVAVRDLYRRQDLGTFAASFTAEVCTSIAVAADHGQR